MDETAAVRSMDSLEGEEIASVSCENDAKLLPVKDESTNFNTPHPTTSIKVEENPNSDYGGHSHENGDDEEEEEEEFYRPPEPRYDKANSLNFRQLCHRFETLWKQKSKKKKPSKDEILDYLLPRSLQKFIHGDGKLGKSGETKSRTNISTDAANQQQQQQQSMFPLLRLLCPDKDTTRPRLYMKEAVIAKTWAEAIGLSNKGSDYNKLVHYNDPSLAGMNATGDISMCVYEVVQKRYPELDLKHGGVTIGTMNELLDELAGIRNFDPEPLGGTHDPSTRATAAATSTVIASNTVGNRGVQTRRKAWVRKLLNMKFSAVEHKWIVRIILGKLELGVGSDTIINYYHPYAEGLYAANKNLKTLCSTLCDKEYMMRRKRQIEEEIAAVDDVNRTLHLPKNDEPAVLNHTISPMLSLRTSFQSILTDLQTRHQVYAELLDKSNPYRTCLALKFPAFACEVKLDGERLLSHVHRGVVKVQTRRGNWYSQLYSPVLGPFIREALGAFDVDVILDGEVVAWDDREKITLPFGWNRRVAKARKEWMHRNEMLDERDLNLHLDEEDVNVVSNASFNFDEKEKLAFETRQNLGSDVWMKYVVFDIPYLGGPDAQNVMGRAFEYLPKTQRPTTIGSILHLDLMKRKRILYTLLKAQKNKLEHVETMVIRSDGRAVDGQTYFANPMAFEYGFSPLTLDSVDATLDNLVSNISDVDTKRRNARTDVDIDKERAQALDKFYGDVVTRRNLEGLIFKDLSSPYCFGTKYRRLGYWYKLKDDYSQIGHAADIDVVVVGGSYASGTRNAKYLNSFLIACVDDGSEAVEGIKYMTLGTCNGNIIGDENLRRLLEKTGYKVNESTGEINYGSWFQAVDNPPFLSQRTFQFSTVATMGGWKPDKKDKPDLWINPEDSFVLTTFAGEIVATKHFSAGVSLRFPRISAVRKEGFDGEPKSAGDVETVSALHELYYSRRAQQVTAERECQIPNEMEYQIKHQSVFYPVMMNSKGSKITRKRLLSNIPSVRAPKIRKDIPLQSDTFKNMSFTVLDGTYRLDAEGLDGQIAKSEGWFDLAKSVRDQQDVVNFIVKHGGKCHLTANSSTNFVIGGDVDDPRVAMFCKSIDAAHTKILGDNRKKDLQLHKILDIGGVVKWTFLYSTVNRKLSRSDEIQLLPRRHDYIVLSKFAEEKLLEREDIYGLHLYKDANLFDFKRAMIEVEKCYLQEAESHSNHHSSTVEYLDNEKEVLRTALQRRFAEGHTGGKQIILYPDLFELETFGDTSKPDTAIRYDMNEVSVDAISDRMSTGNIASSLLLVKATGINITFRLNEDVTHILCDITQDFLPWEPNIPLRMFYDVQRGDALMKKVSVIKKSSRDPILFISPSWIRKQWMGDGDKNF